MPLPEVICDVGRERIEADIIAGPAWTLNGRAFRAATGQRAPARSLSLEASGPHKMTETAHASGA